MRRLHSMALVLGMILLLVVGCANMEAGKQRLPQEVIIKIQSDTPTKLEVENRVVKNMEVKNPEGNLSPFAFINGKTGYLKLFGHISTYDSVSVWTDMILFENVYKIDKLNIYVSSGGGGAFSGLALADDIERISLRLDVTTYASGIVASAAVPVFAVGKKRIASKGTIFMVHHATSFKFFESGGEKDAVAEVEMFKLLKKRYLEKLAAHSKLSTADWLTKLDNITWFDAEQAKEWGLVDEIY